MGHTDQAIHIGQGIAQQQLVDQDSATVRKAEQRVIREHGADAKAQAPRVEQSLMGHGGEGLLGHKGSVSWLSRPTDLLV